MIRLESAELTVVALWWYLKRDGVGQMKDDGSSGIKHIHKLKAEGGPCSGISRGYDKSRDLFVTKQNPAHRASFPFDPPFHSNDSVCTHPL